MGISVRPAWRGLWLGVVSGERQIMLVQLLTGRMKGSRRRVFRCWPIVYRAAVLHGANEGEAQAFTQPLRMRNSLF